MIEIESSFPSNLTQQIGLSNHPETRNFDLRAGETWVYPINYPVRDYQFNIIKSALYHNTLISLPTGLGKTFIAAVIMYNFYRWYPFGKIIFMAPTRPLVKQQVDACFDIMAIPKDVTVQLTGANSAANRASIWSEKRVFFITPHVLRNDLPRLLELSQKICCIIFDEAHHAKGRYAYCEVIEKILPINPYFRVVALSATPGSKVSDIIEVIQNLLIEKIEVRTEESLDVRPYVFNRKVKIIEVPTEPKIEEISDKMLEIIEIFAKPLFLQSVLSGNAKNFTKNRILMERMSFQQRYRDKPNIRPAFYEQLSKSFNICVSLYHGYELLQRHGLRNFVTFFENKKDNWLLKDISQLNNVVKNVNEYLGPKLSMDFDENQVTPNTNEGVHFGHLKHYRLCEILDKHFQTAKDTNTKCIVFCEYRESAREVYAALMQKKPLIRPKMFMGQGMMSQKEQIAIIEEFRSGKCNTLVSTSIGEEGLDVGEVDLIVCFDVSTRSPIRLVQRMGRTGRKREGSVIFLVTKGKEYEALQSALKSKNYLNDRMLFSRDIQENLYKSNPRMIPSHLVPRCQNIFMTVTDSGTKDKFKKKKTPALDDRTSMDHFNYEYNEADPYNGVQHDVIHCAPNIPIQFDVNKYLKYENFLDLKATKLVSHSTNSLFLNSLLEFSDAKRLNLPSPKFELFSHINTVEKKRMIFDGTSWMTGNQRSSHANVKTLQISKFLTGVKKYVENDEMFNSKSVQCKMCPKNRMNCPKSSCDVFPIIDRIDLSESYALLERISSIDLNEQFEFEQVPSLDSIEHSPVHLDFAESTEINDEVLNTSILDLEFNYRNSRSRNFDEYPQIHDASHDNPDLLKLTEIEDDDVNSFNLLNNVSCCSSERNCFKTFGYDTLDDLLCNLNSDSENDINNDVKNFDYNDNNDNNIFHENGDKDDGYKNLSCHSPEIFSGSDDDSIFQNIDKMIDDIVDKEENCSRAQVSPKTLSIIPESNTKVENCSRSQLTLQPLSINLESNTHFEGDSSTQILSINPELNTKAENRSRSQLTLQPLSINLESNTHFEGDSSTQILSINPELNTKAENRSRSQINPKPLSIIPELNTKVENCSRSQLTLPPLSINLEETRNGEPDYYNMETQPLYPNKERSPEMDFDATQLFVPDKCEESNFCINDTETFNTKFWDDSILDQLLLNDDNNDSTPCVASIRTGTDSSSPENVHISKRRKICLKLKKNDSDCDKSPLLSQYEADNNFRKISLKNRKSRRKICKFIDYEADESSDCSSDDLENTMVDDCYEKDFINDESHVDSPSINTKYLQSTKSPNVANCGFKIPDMRTYPAAIYSQIPDNNDETYIHDTFCISNDEIIYKTELSQIDILERELRRKKKRQFKRIRLFTDDQE